VNIVQPNNDKEISHFTHLTNVTNINLDNIDNGNILNLNNENIDGNLRTVSAVESKLTDNPKEILNKDTQNIVEHSQGSRTWTNRTNCPYCFQDITHFPRHLERNHKDEGAVKELLSLSKEDPRRKTLIESIRKQGNYFLNMKTKIIRPVRMKKINKYETSDEYVPCQDCFGFYKRNYLRRHRKSCALRSSKSSGDREKHLTESQKFMVCSGYYKDFYNSLRLKDEVFTIMSADEISKTAMEDVLTCSYVEGLLSKYKRTQIRMTISNKIRELASKVISGYDPVTRSFKASSLALHMATTLKQVCDVAMKLIIKKSPLIDISDSESSFKNIKRLKQIFTNHWNIEISSLALKDMNEKSWKRPKLFPLTSDLMQFQKFSINEANKACENIKNDKDVTTEYRRLAENVLALTLFLPQDVYQTAKVSKLLLAINKGKGSDYKGKSLDEIEFSDNAESYSDENDEVHKYDNDSYETTDQSSIRSYETPSLPLNTDKKGKQKILREKWSEEQKSAITSFFKDHIKNKKVPKKNEVEDLINSNKTLFEGRNWVVIKAYVYNCYRK
ncbi:hypothetical protein NQ314_017706, partial [Rhamnusium bicolor]